MSALINVDPQKKDDVFYRYKMPAIMTKIEGNGNGIKTVFPNIREVCAKLSRPPEVLNKFFGYELGAQSTFVKNDDKYLVMGAFTQEKIQQKVYDFITRVVLCKQCRNPETDPKIEGKGKLVMTCRSCGKTTEIASTERIQKLMVECYKQQARGAPTPATGAGGAAAGGADGGAAAPDNVAEVTANATEATPTASSADKPAKASKVKVETTAEQLQQANPVLTLANVVRQVPPPRSDVVIQKVLEIKAECSVSDKDTIRFVWRGVLESVEGAKFISELQKWIGVVAHFAQKDQQYEVVLKELAKTCSQYNLMHKFPMALKMLWEEQVVPEADIKAFVESYKGGKEVKKEVMETIRVKCEPLMKWLAGEEL